MTDEFQATATEGFGASNDAQRVLESQARAFSDLGRTLNEAVENAMKQASEITGRAQEHATTVVTQADRRVAEGLRQATVAERRAAAAQTRLSELETRLDQAQAKLSMIGAQANEIARLVTTIDILPAHAEPTELGADQDEHASAESWSAPHEVVRAKDHDAFTALASLRDIVDRAG